MLQFDGMLVGIHSATSPSSRPSMISTRHTRRLVAAATALVAMALAPSSLAAQQNSPNTTGLPLYAKVTTGSEYPSVKEETGTYKVYTAQSSDPIATIEAWYHHALPKAVEMKDDTQPSKLIVLKSGKDIVLIYSLADGSASIIKLQKYIGP
jgi:hypothetical protein